MKNYRLTIQYDGTRYSGWQVQGNTANTIQGKLVAVLSALDGSTVEVQGAGRTDAGVHAAGQVASVKLRSEPSPEELIRYCSRYLPHDIAVTGACEAGPRFHARLNAVKKCYVYRIRTTVIPDVFGGRFRCTYSEPLDIAAMREAAACLTGEHDFRSFCGLKNFKKSAVRTVFDIRLTESPDGLDISFVGDGFLNQMVRILTGTLIEVGAGKREPESMKAVLAAKDRAAAGPAMPPHGLCLEYVEY